MAGTYVFVALSQRVRQARRVQHTPVPAPRVRDSGDNYYAGERPASQPASGRLRHPRRGRLG